MPEVRLVGPNGEQVGIVRIEDALRLAQEAELDLVEVAATARPPVCKLMDYGKFKYESAQKARESRRNQQLTVIKEQKLRPKIDTHDYETKKRNVVRFLEGGNKVKVTIMFRGREQSRPELGFRLLQRLAEDVAELGTVEAAPKQDGRNMTMVIAPNKKPTPGRAPRRRRRRRTPPGPDRPGGPSARQQRSRTTRTSALAPRSGAPPVNGPSMPKNKTHSGTAKRVKITGSGKLRRQQTRLRHRLEVKSSTVTRRQSGTVPSPRPTSSGSRSFSAADGDRSGHDAPGSEFPADPGTAAFPVPPPRQETGTPMARVKRAVNAQKKRRTTLELASGYRGQRSRLYRKAKEQMLHSLNYAYRDRRAKKGDFRQLWITRINAAARQNGMTYNRFIQGLKIAGVEVDRKILAELAVSEPAAFAALVDVARANVPAAGVTSQDGTAA